MREQDATQDAVSCLAGVDAPQAASCLAGVDAPQEAASCLAGVHAPQDEASCLAGLVSADDPQTVLACFRQLLASLDLQPHRHSSIYPTIRARLDTPAMRALWRLLDKRRAMKEYQGGTACAGRSMLVVGGGPCGLRMAIEGALLGCQVLVLEKRRYISRNNVLHLWPFLIHDLKQLGVKFFYPQFVVGSVNHISIRKLQITLMKIALLLGVEIHCPVTFEGLVEPPQDGSGGWRARVSPSDHPAAGFEFDVVIGADGKKNTLTGFKRKCFRGKLAIAITANFVNHHTKQEARVEEIPGFFYIFKQDFFNGIRHRTGIDLENLVYFRDETHYFVFTAKKKSLLDKGVLSQDYPEPAELLAPSNINRAALLNFAKETADDSTGHRLSNLEFARDHHGNEDVAIFDFTALHQAEHASLVVEKAGKRLLMGIVGDTLLEPFWPTGSGMARGLLSVLDAAWMVRNWSLGHMSPTEVIAERESILPHLSQTSPSSLRSKFSQHTIDPVTRYGSRMNTGKEVRAEAVEQLFVTEIPSHQVQLSHFIPRRVKRTGSEEKPCVNVHAVLVWYQRHLQEYGHIARVTDLGPCWRDGLVFGCLLHKLRPGLIDIGEINKRNTLAIVEDVFQFVQEALGIAPVMSAEDLTGSARLDSLALTAYLAQVKDALQVYQHSSCTETLGCEEALNRDLKPSAMGMLMMVSDSMVADGGRKRRTPEENSEEDEATLISSLAGNVSKRIKDLQAQQRRHGCSVPLEHIGESSTDVVERRPRMKAWKVRRFEIAMQDKKTQQQAAEPANPKAGRQAAFEPTAEDRENHNENDQEQSVEKELNFVQNVAQVKEVFWENSEINEGIFLAETCSEAEVGSVVSSQEIRYQREGDKSEMEKHDTLPYNTYMIDSDTEHTKKNDEAVNVDKIESRSTKGNAGQLGQHIVSEQCLTGGKAPWTLPANESGVRNMRNIFTQLSSQTVPQQKTSLERDGAVSAEWCCLCHQRLYLVERHTLYGYFFHKNCFRCHKCRTLLRLGGHYMMAADPSGQVAFYCYQHYYQRERPSNIVAQEDEGKGRATSCDEGLSKMRELERKMPYTLGLKTEETGNRNDDVSAQSNISKFKDIGVPNAKLTSSADSTGSSRSGGTSMDMNLDIDFKNKHFEEEDRPLPVERVMSHSDDEDGRPRSYTFESSEEDDNHSLTGSLENLTTVLRPGGGRRRQVLRSSVSSRLLQAAELQHQLEALEEEEAELEMEGLQVEADLRQQEGKETEDNGGREMLFADWLSLLKQKTHLQSKESRLMLKVKLLELKEQLRALKQSAGAVSGGKSVDSADEDAVSDHMMALVEQVKELKIYLMETETIAEAT